MKIALILLSLSLASFAITKEEVNAALDAMVKSGKFSQAQINEAKAELSKMSDKDLQKIERNAKMLKDSDNIKIKARQIKLDKEDMDKLKK